MTPVAPSDKTVMEQRGPLPGAATVAISPPGTVQATPDTSNLAGTETHLGQDEISQSQNAQTLAPSGEFSTAVPVTLDLSGPAGPTDRTQAFSWDPNAGEAPRTSGVKGAPHVAGYEILSELGRGGMGVVYRARHRSLKRDVALKMVLAGNFASAEQLNRFRAEAEAVAKLQHPNIVQIYDVGEQNGLPYFSLEFVDGASLDKALAGKPQLEVDSALIVETLARAMHYAHERGIVHRDLKPGNVLLTKQGDAKITDFGLVKRMEADDSGTTRTGTIMGTPGYMAPEQGRGDKDVGPLADVYALGSILYAMLTGRPPFLAATPLDTLMQLLHKEPVPPSQLQPRISRDIETICLKSLQKEPARRYASALDLADDLRRLLNKEPILARPVGHVERLWRWCRRHPLVAGLSALAAGLALVVLIGAPIAAVKIAVERDAAIVARDDAKTAQGRAETAQKLAETNEQKAVRAQQAADVQTGLSLEALQTLVTRVQNQLRETPDTQKLKQDLLRTGLDGLRKVATSAKGARRADAMMAEAHQRMGDIFQSLAQHAEAREQYEQSHAIRLELAKAGTAAAQSNVALSFTKLGDISLLEGHRELAYQHYSEALRLREALAGKQPEGTAQRDLATSYVKLGGVSEPEEARKYFGQALKIRQSIAANTTDVTRPNRERDVWITLNKLAELSLQLKDLAAAGEYYDQALAQAVKLQGLVPQSARAKSDLAESYLRAGAVRARLGKLDDAKSDFGQALDLLRPLADEDPKNIDIQRNLALALARHGDHALAAAKAEVLRGMAPQNYLNLYNVACCYSLAADAVASGKSADALTDDEVAAQQRYADQAIAALRQAADRGLKGTEEVMADADLDAIRSHPEYPQLLEKLAAAESSGVTSPAQP